MVDGIGPQGGIEVKASGELLEYFLVEGPPAPAFGVVPEAECDLAQVEAVEIVVGQVPEDVLARAVLRNPSPRPLVLACQDVHDVEGKRFRTRHGPLGS